MGSLPLIERWSVRLVRERSEFGTVARVTGPADIVSLFNLLHGESPVEMVEAFYLNVRHSVIGHSLISQGTSESSLIKPADVFRPAILANANAVIVAHNHPSGEPSFSPEDRHIARLLSQAGEILGIPVLDVLAITHDGRFSSAAEEGGL